MRSDNADSSSSSSSSSSNSDASRTPSTLRALVPGAAQGAVTVLLGHPLDTAKTRMQALHVHTSTSLARTMARMYREDGVRSFYRGATPPLLVYATKRSVQFAAWEQLQRRLHLTTPPSRQHATPPAATTEGAAARVGGARGPPHRAEGHGGAGAVVGHVARRCCSNPFVAGALAGAAGTLLGCPLHVIKIQTQCQTTMLRHNAWSCALAIAREDGVRGFYRGVCYQLAKDASFAACYLGSYSVLTSNAHIVRLVHSFGRRSSSGSGSSSSSSGSDGSNTTAVVSSSSQSSRTSASHMTHVFCAGVVASMLTWTLLYPLDTVKTLVQSRNAAVLATVATVRPRTLYRGIVASLLRAGPVSGASMLVYEALKP